MDMYIRQIWRERGVYDPPRQQRTPVAADPVVQTPPIIPTPRWGPDGRDYPHYQRNMRAWGAHIYLEVEVPALDRQTSVWKYLHLGPARGNTGGYHITNEDMSYTFRVMEGWSSAQDNLELIEIW